MSTDDVPNDVCDKLIKWCSIKVGTFGSVTAAPASIPVIGAIGTSVLSTTVDVAFLIRTQIELCYAISCVYDSSMSENKLKALSLALLGYDDNEDLAIDIAASSFKTFINELSSKYLRKGIEKTVAELAPKLAARLMSRAASRLIPLISIPINASLNVSAIRTTGKRARSYFSQCTY